MKFSMKRKNNQCHDAFWSVVSWNEHLFKDAVAWHKTQIAVTTRDEATKQQGVGGSRL